MASDESMTSDVLTVSPEGLPSGAALPARHRIGNFELLSVASRSSAGLVYRAWDHALARPVAIKEYLPTALALRDASLEIHSLGLACAAEFERGCAAFIEEARMLARCDHPSLVRVLSLFEASGTAYRVMPWYAGHPLPQARRKIAGPVGELALRGFLDSLLGALEAYQQVGSMHLGVRPSQVLWLDDERPLLLGPGMAGRAAQTPSLEALGADSSEAGFAPPEQALASDDQPLGPWSDFHALAAVARFWITGVAPSAAGMAAPEPLAATVERLFGPSPSARYSASLLSALDAALSPDTARRPQTAAQFREALQGAPLHQAAPAAASLHAVDTATADMIRCVIDSIDEPGEAALRPDPNDVPTLRADPADRVGMGARRKPFPVRGHRLLWAGGALAALAVVATVGFGALEFQSHPLRLSAAPWWPAVAPPQPELQARVPTEPPPMPAAALPERASPAAPPSAAPASAAPAPVVHASAARAKGATTESIEQSPLTTQAMPNSPAPKAAPAVPTASVEVAVTPTRLEAAVRTAKADAASRTTVSSPRQECGARTEFALYRCMQQLCSLARWRRHPQCVQLEETDSVE